MSIVSGPVMASFDPATGEAKYKDALVPRFSRRPKTAAEVAEYRAAWKRYRETPAQIAADKWRKEQKAASA